MEEVANVKRSNNINRRTFIGASASAALALAVVGCASENRLDETDASDRKVYRLDPELDESVEGKWIPAACWHNCGGRCVNYAYVVDDVVLRQKTDDTHEDSPDYPQQRGCLRGRSMQQLCFGADRVKYPMKRTHWEPGGGDKSLRGSDTWERITWEEALDYVANELKNAKEKYGNESILHPSWGIHMYGDVCRVLGEFGGYTEVADTASFGSFGFDIGSIGLPPMAKEKATDRLSYRKSDYIILYGCNPGWANGGNPTYHYHVAKEAGAQYVFVGPEYNVTAAVLEAKWIRVRPGTDTAFLLAVAYEMIKADEAANGSIIDSEFLNTYTLGFDLEHMPEDATSNECFKDYVLGEYDGIPKTAEWASEICGTPVEDIRWYAGIMSREYKVSTLHSFAAARCNNAEELPQLLYSIAAMGGHFVGEGNACGSCYQAFGGNNGSEIVSAPLSGQPMVPNVEGIACLSGPELWQGILDGKYNYTGNCMMGDGAHAPSEMRDIDIHVIYHENRATLLTNLGLTKGIEVHKKVDFVVTQDYAFNTCAQYSDIILPVSTIWERDDSPYIIVANREMRFYPSKIIEPLYETKDDAWIVRELAIRLGIDPDKVSIESSMQRKYNVISGSTVADPEGNTTPLATITQDDIDELGVEGEPQDGVIGLSELLEQGFYQVPRSEGDGYNYNGWDDYCNDPVANPLPSKSGKFEIYCQEKANIINGMNRSTVKPYPTYTKPLNGYEDSFSDWDNRIKGEYPYQITNPHYLRRTHNRVDNLPWLREALQSPFWINVDDAAEKGIVESDTVLIYNQYGKVLRQATLTERLMPGVVALTHGAWLEFEEGTDIDKAGAENMLAAPVCQGIGTSGYNTNLVNFEKYDGSALEPDYTWPQKAIEI